MRDTLVAIILVCGVATACSQNGGTTDAAADVTTVDHPAADVAADQNHDATITPTYGVCGQSAYTCLCACPSFVDAGGTCQENCLGTVTCARCFNDGLTTCCPTQSDAYNTCLIMVTTPPDGGTAACGMTDFVCQNAMCATQNTALNECIVSDACATTLANCWGTYLVTCGTP